MPPPARKPDPQTDYEDPIDRLYRRRSTRTRQGTRHGTRRDRPRRETPDKMPSGAASVAYAFGFVGLIPVLGLLFAPLAVLLGVIGLAATRDPLVSGKGKAKSGLWFGLIGLVINYLIPFGLYLYLDAHR